MNKKFELKKLLPYPQTLFEKFHNVTKIGSPQPASKKANRIYAKAYPRFNEIILPKPKKPKGILYKNIITPGLTFNKFSTNPLSTDKISSLLFYSAGVKNSNTSHYERFYQSIDNTYPLEIYIIALNTDIPKGIYHYYPKNHSLEELSNIKSVKVKRYFYECPPGPACIILISAVFKRTTSVYGDPGYKHILIESGRLAQNIRSNSTLLELKTFNIYQFNEVELEKILDIDGIDESLIGAIAMSA